MALILLYYFEDFLEENEETVVVEETDEETFIVEETDDEIYFFSQLKLQKLSVIFLYKYCKKANKKTNVLIKNKTNSKIFQLLKTEFKFKSYNSFTTLFFLYYQLYFSQLLKFPIIFRLLNTRDIVSKDLIYFGVHASKIIKWKQYNILYDKEIVENLFFALSIRNLKLFVNWIQKYFEKAVIKRHRKLFILFSVLLGKFIWKFNIFLQLKGLRLSLRGKFGKAGSVRKVRKYVRRGRCSYSSKNLALESKSTIIRTLTGVYSITFEIFF